MRIQEYVINETREKMEEVFRYMEAVPEDKWNWKPLDAGRSVLDMAKEIAKCPDWAYSIISTDKRFEFDEAAQAESRKEQEGWTTIAICKEECKKRLEKLFELYKGVSDGRLKETKWLPFNGGRDHTYLEMLDYPRWNFNYHLGQVAYIQTLYGDANMY